MKQSSSFSWQVWRWVTQGSTRSPYGAPRQGAITSGERGFGEWKLRPETRAWGMETKRAMPKATERRLFPGSLQEETMFTIHVRKLTVHIYKSADIDIVLVLKHHCSLSLNYHDSPIPTLLSIHEASTDSGHCSENLTYPITTQRCLPASALYRWHCCAVQAVLSH